MLANESMYKWNNSGIMRDEIYSYPVSHRAVVAVFQRSPPPSGVASPAPAEEAGVSQTKLPSVNRISTVLHIER